MSEYGKSIEIPVEALEPTLEESAQLERMCAVAKQLGRAARLTARKIARDAGVTVLPGAQMRVGPRGGPMRLVVMPPEDLTVLLPEEES